MARRAYKLLIPDSADFFRVNYVCWYNFAIMRNMDQVPSEIEIRKCIRGIAFGKDVFCPVCRSQKVVLSERRYRCRRCRCHRVSTPIAVAKSGAEGGASEQSLRNRLRGNNRGRSDGGKASRRSSADLAGACSGGEFVVFRAGGA